MQILLICILIKTTKTRSDKQLRFNHTLYETNFKPKLSTANVECNGTVIKLPKTEKPIRFLSFKFSLNGGDLVFWFTFNLSVADFRPKMALTLEILSDQIHTLPRNNVVHTILILFASFRRSKSALCHLLCEATCSLSTDKRDLTNARRRRRERRLVKNVFLFYFEISHLFRSIQCVCWY